ncbi:MAG: tetratricopeptide repeat protein [Nannocystaceae bacterium]
MRDQLQLNLVLALGLLSLSGCSDPPSTVPAPRMDQVHAAKTGEGSATPAAVTDEQYEADYRAAKAVFVEVPPGNSLGLKGVLNSHGTKLRAVADKAQDTHLRANASLMLGRLYEGSEDRKAAISYYRQARDLLPEELDIQRGLAIALASDRQFSKAVPIQKKVVEQDPDDLGARLLLGEILIKAGREEDGTRAYAEYEVRRKGLIDGLTLHDKEKKYVKPPEERMACALALAPARDNGTALALLYALKFDPEVKVRAAVVEAMGVQRLAGYRERLEARVALESDAEMKETIQWALSEIKRDPVETQQGVAPTQPSAEGNEAGAAPAAKDPVPGTNKPVSG